MTFEAIDTSFPVFALALLLAFFAVLGVMALLVVLTARRGEPVPRLRLVPPLTEAGGGSLTALPSSKLLHGGSVGPTVENTEGK